MRDSAQVGGHINPGSNLASALLELQVTAAPRELPAGRVEQSEWQGMSGAVVRPAG